MLLAIALAGLLSALPAAPASADSPSLHLITEPGAGIAPIETLFAHARHTVDLVIYELVDPRFEAILAADASRGVTVRVLLDRENEASRNAAAYAYLSAHHVAVRWASDPSIELTHEKAAVIDNATALVMSLNFVYADYTTTRDFAIVDSDRADVMAIDTVFAADWRGVRVAPSNGSDLVWSPGAESALVALINGARKTLLVENEEMADPYITRPLEAAARRGVHVEVVMTASSDWDSAFRALSDAGVSVRTYASSAKLYIHAKAIVADAGQTAARAFVGSQNFSITSLVHNRELGLITSAPTIVSGLAATISSDYAHAQHWQS